jgi:hypothetical protein
MRTIALFLILSGAGWQTIDFHGLFTFRLADGFTQRAATGPDDVRAEYDKGPTKLVIVWGQSESLAYNDRQQNWMHDYHETTTRLRGLRANIRTYSQDKNSQRLYAAELNVGNWEKGEVQLYMRLESDDPALLPVAEEIFKSVTFPRPSPERSSRP